MCDMEGYPIIYTKSDTSSLDRKIETVVKDKDEYRIKIEGFELKRFKEIVEEYYAVNFIEGKKTMAVSLEKDNFKNVMIVEEDGTLRFEYNLLTIEMIATYLEKMDEYNPQIDTETGRWN